MFGERRYSGRIRSIAEARGIRISEDNVHRATARLLAESRSTWENNTWGNPSAIYQRRRRGGPPRRLGDSGSPLAIANCIFSRKRQNGRKNGREGRQERAAIRTWTLDALRAATEPVKVEAMQAIVEVGFGLKSGWCVQEWLARRHLLAFVTRNATAIRRMWPIETPRDSETHAVIGPSDPPLPTETGWISRAGGNRIPGKIEL